MGIAENTQLKLLAIVLPEPVFSLVVEQQNYIASTWGPRRALQTPPHLTLIEPLALSDDQITILENLCTKLTAIQTPFHIRVSGYSAFMPRVIFMNPILPPELLLLQTEMRNKIRELMPDVLKKYQDRTFDPHITLAHRDVNPDQFNLMWKHYQHLHLDLEFQVNTFHVLGHRTDGWAIEKEYIFNHT